MKFLFLIALITSTLTSICSQSTCHEPGECLLGTSEDATHTKNYNECLEYCQTKTSCDFFTHYGQSENCLTFRDCPLLSNATCADCYTGERNCSFLQQCGQLGKCEGAFLRGEERESELDCSVMCRQFQICTHYSYDTETKICIALASCESVLNTPNWIWGDSTCGNLNPASYYTALMVVGGIPSTAYYDIEVIDLSGSIRTCIKPIDYPSEIEYASTGVYFDGFPTVCGGTSPHTNECYKYNYQVVTDTDQSTVDIG